MSVAYPNPRTGVLGTAVVNRSSSGDGSAVVAGVAGKSIRVVAWALKAAAGVVVYWKDQAGNALAAPSFSPPTAANTMIYQAGGGEMLVEPALNDAPQGAGLFLNLSGAVQVDGVVLYTLV